MKGPILVICIHTNETDTTAAHNTVEELTDMIQDTIDKQKTVILEVLKDEEPKIRYKVQGREVGKTSSIVRIAFLGECTFAGDYVFFHPLVT